VERCFEQVSEIMTRGADAFDPAIALPDADVLKAMGNAYMEALATNRDALMLQLQAYAACEDDVVRERVRANYARLVRHVAELSGADTERLDDFFRYGMWLNVTAAIGVEDLSAGCAWMQDLDAPSAD
jgi:hypothetical protein